MKTLLATIPALVFLYGCATTTTQWSETGFDGAPRDRALAECDYEAAKATVDLSTGFDKDYAREDVRDACMRAQGFKTTET